MNTVMSCPQAIEPSTMPANSEFRYVRGRSGNRIRLAVAGEGPLVLMVHGFPDVWLSWRHQIGPIANAGFTAAAMDTRGYGGSDDIDGVKSHSLKALVEDIVAVIDELGGGSAILLGHDWGGQQVYATALIHPEKVRAVVGFSSSAANFSDRKPSSVWPGLYGDDFFYHRFFWKPGVAEAEIMKDTYRFLWYFYYGLSGQAGENSNPLRQSAKARSLLDDLPAPGKLTWLSDDELDYCARSFAASGMTGPLNRYRAVDIDVDEMRAYADRRITQPALWVGGARDPARYMIPNIDRYANNATIERFANLRGMLIVEGAGHWIPQEAPAEVNAFLMPFLKALIPAV